MLFEQTSLTEEEVLALNEPFKVLGEDCWDIQSIDGTKWTFDFVESCYIKLYPDGEDAPLTEEEIRTLLESTTPEEQEALGITVIDTSKAPSLDPFDDLPPNPS